MKNTCILDWLIYSWALELEAADGGRYPKWKRKKKGGEKKAYFFFKVILSFIF